LKGEHVEEGKANGGMAKGYTLKGITEKQKPFR